MYNFIVKKTFQSLYWHKNVKLMQSFNKIDLNSVWDQKLNKKFSQHLTLNCCVINYSFGAIAYSKYFMLRLFVFFFFQILYQHNSCSRQGTTNKPNHWPVMSELTFAIREICAWLQNSVCVYKDSKSMGATLSRNLVHKSVSSFKTTT